MKEHIEGKTLLLVMPFALAQGIKQGRERLTPHISPPREYRSYNRLHPSVSQEISNQASNSYLIFKFAALPASEQSAKESRWKPEVKIQKREAEPP